MATVSSPPHHPATAGGGAAPPSPRRHHFLKKKIQIGSCAGGGNVNFSKKEAVFHHDTITPERRARKEEVRAWAKQDALIRRHSSWNYSTDPQVPICVRKSMQNFVNDRSRAYEYNYRAERLPPKALEPLDKSTKFHISRQTPEQQERILTAKMNDRISAGFFPRTTEWVAPPPPHGGGGPGQTGDWRPSTLLTADEKVEAYSKLMKASIRHSALSNSKVAENPAYKTPLERTVELQEEVRRQKATGEFNVRKPVFQAEERPVDRRSLRNRYAIEPSRKFKTTSHSGVWEFNKIEGRYMWSDTGSFDYGARGDSEHVHNPDGYNFAAPGMAGTTQNY